MTVLAAPLDQSQTILVRSQQKFEKVPTLPIESGGEEEITDFDNTLYIS